MEDYLAALKARLKPLKRLGIDMVDAAIHTFGALWPGVENPKSVKDLAEYLKTSSDRITEWRESAARVGADEALSFVLSWYEGIKLETLQSMRTGSKWTTDPDLIKRRQATAYSFIPYANIHTFVEDPDEGEEKEEGEEQAEADTGSDIEADTAPSSSGIAADTAPSSSGTAADIDPSGSGPVA